MYCKNCGNQLDDKAVICTQCGCLTDLGERLNINLNQTIENQPKQQTASSTNNTLGLVAKILMIITCVFTGFYIIPLCWTIPMTVSLSKKLKNNQPISVGFKICILLFVNTIAGILLLCMKDNEIK